MIDISNFLQKFLNIEKDYGTKLVLILEAVKKQTGIEISKEMLEIKGNNLKINCNSVMRSEIFMHQTEIESDLESKKIFLKII